VRGGQGNILPANEYAELGAYFVRFEELTSANKTDATAVCVGALTIRLRDGVEAVLSRIAMVAFFRDAERLQALRYVHAGAWWLSWHLSWSVNVSQGCRKFRWMMATPIIGLRLPMLGIYPTIGTYGAQLALLLAAGLVFDSIC
jgi:hypothetical protein